MEVKAVKLEPDLIGCIIEHQNSKPHFSTRHNSEERDRCSNDSNGHSNNSTLDQAECLENDSSASPISSAPLCRQFWKVGNYEDGLASNTTHQTGKNYLHVHPMFLHSNATSHKWVFGAIAELLDNAFDEIQNGATFVNVDKTINPRDNTSALFIQDNGGGMDPEAMRCCMSFGFSEKNSKSAIGQYGNGFKTSSMRLGADVIVFSRHQDSNGKLTQTIGLLSYTFLTRTGQDRIVVPMVDYEFNQSTGRFNPLREQQFASNLSVLLEWSPFSTEAKLLKQFDDFGLHGTKVIIYNLWCTEDGKVELDFDTDSEDIRLADDSNKTEKRSEWRTIHEQHITNRFKYSLRVYLSILYLRIPETFKIILRGRVVEHHNLADDLKFLDYILYQPQSGGCVEGTFVTTIGFLKEAPLLNIHGFSIYHKNRLILPFWKVVSYAHSKGRGVVGVLEANFVEPTHNKQDFERTSLFQKIEVRLKAMLTEYWECNCEKIGYQVPKRAGNSSVGDGAKATVDSSSVRVGLKRMERDHSLEDESLKRQAIVVANLACTNQICGMQPINSAAVRVGLKRMDRDLSLQDEKVKSQAIAVANLAGNDQICGMQPVNSQLKDQGTINVVQQNKKLRAQCFQHEQWEGKLNLKVRQLRSELGEVHREYARLLVELKSLDRIKEEKMLYIC